LTCKSHTIPSVAFPSCMLPSTYSSRVQDVHFHQISTTWSFCRNNDFISLLDVLGSIQDPLSFYTFYANQNSLFVFLFQALPGYLWGNVRTIPALIFSYYVEWAN
jgi:hypothetical protein